MNPIVVFAINNAKIYNYSLDNTLYTVLVVTKREGGDEEMDEWL